eukprot:2553922-Rhodomonas_salina.2
MQETAKPANTPVQPRAHISSMLCKCKHNRFKYLIHVELCVDRRNVAVGSCVVLDDSINCLRDKLEHKVEINLPDHRDHPV